jgi:hypothetical protein
MVASLDNTLTGRCTCRNCPAGSWPIIAEAGETPLRCENRAQAVRAAYELRQLSASGEIRLTTRAAAVVSSRCGGATGELLARLLGTGTLVLLRAVERPWLLGSAEPREPEWDDPITPSEPEVETAWIRFRVLDEETGAPLSNVRMLIREPDGMERERVTAADGTIEIPDLPPGTCDIVRLESDPSFEVREVTSQ